MQNVPDLVRERWAVHHDDVVINSAIKGKNGS
jgi:hypothetical protein